MQVAGSSHAINHCPATAPDLESYLRVHRVLRASAAELATATRAPADPAADEGAEALVPGVRRARSGVITTSRTSCCSPRWRRGSPPTGEHASRLEGDHAELDEVLDGLEAALDRGDLDAAAPLATALRDHLDEHLGYEDDEIAPLFARHFTAVEFDELNARAVRMTSPRQLLFTAPWLLAGVDQDEQARILASVPKALHLLWFATRRRYARLAGRALGPVRLSPSSSIPFTRISFNRSVHPTCSPGTSDHQPVRLVRAAPTKEHTMTDTRSTTPSTSRHPRPPRRRPPSPRIRPATPKRIVRRWVAAMNAGDLSAIDELVADDIVDHHLPEGIPAGRPGVILWCSLLRDALQLHLDIEDLVATDDRVAIRARITGTHVAEFAGMPATGRRFDASIMTIERVAAGRIAERWELVDMSTVMAQLTGDLEV